MMRLLKNGIGISAFVFSSVVCFAAEKEELPELKETLSSIKETFGFVPDFVKAYPDEGLPGAWQEFAAMQSSKTALTEKMKNLISLGVSAQVPCSYCIYWDTKAARNAGATDREIREAISIAAATRHWSTMLNGIQADEKVFHTEMDYAFRFIKDNSEKKDVVSQAPITVINAATAYQDMNRIFGLIPSFLKAVPEDAIAGAWKMMKNIQLNSATELNGKTKELIGLAVSAQVPCQYCTFFHTEAAKRLNGATEQEIRETVTIASLVRHWSTVLNGSMINESKFQSDVDRIFRFMKRQQMKARPMADNSNIRQASVVFDKNSTTQ